MGNSAMDHRVQIGLFAGRMCSSSWSTSTGAFKVSGTRPESDPDSSRRFLLNLLFVVGTIGIMVGVWNHITVPISGLCCVSSSCISPPASQGGTLTEVEVVIERTAGQVRRLLLMSGNIEQNPGPVQPVPPFNRSDSAYMMIKLPNTSFMRNIEAQDSSYNFKVREEIACVVRVQHNMWEVMIQVAI